MSSIKEKSRTPEEIDADLKILVMKIGEAYVSSTFVDEFYGTFFILSPSSTERFRDMSAQRAAMIGLVSGLIAYLKNPTSALKVMTGIRDRHKVLQITNEEYKYFTRSILIVLRRRLTLAEEEQAKLEASADHIYHFMTNTSQRECILV